MPFGDGLRPRRPSGAKNPGAGRPFGSFGVKSLGETGVFGEIFREILGKFLYAAPRKNFHAGSRDFRRDPRENFAKFSRISRENFRDFRAKNRAGRGENFSRALRARRPKNPGAATAFARFAR